MVSQSGQTEVEIPGLVVRQLFRLSSLNLALMNNAWTWIGRFGRVTHYAYIRGEVPFRRLRSKPARPYRRLAITPSRHPGPCLLLFSRAICTDVPATNLKTLLTVRLDMHRPRRPRTHLTTAVRAS